MDQDEKDLIEFIERLSQGEARERSNALAILVEDLDADSRFIPYIEALTEDTSPCLLYVRSYTYAEVRWNAGLALANQHFLSGKKEPILISDMVIPIEKYELKLLAAEAKLGEESFYQPLNRLDLDIDGMSEVELREYYQQEYLAYHGLFLNWFSKLNELNLLPVCDLELDVDFPRSTRWMADLARLTYYENHHSSQYPQVKRVRARRE
jgi:hypothetical protein